MLSSMERAMREADLDVLVYQVDRLDLLGVHALVPTPRACARR